MNVESQLSSHIDAEIKRLRSLVCSTEESFESGSAIDHDVELMIREGLDDLLPRILAALERHGHADRARQLEAQWNSDIDRYRIRYTSIDGGGFTNVIGLDLLARAGAIVGDAVAHREADVERDRATKAAEARRQEERDEASHRRNLEMRQADAAREAARQEAEDAREEARRGATSAEAQATRRWQLWTTLITAAVGIMGILGGNMDKVAAVVGRGPERDRAIVVEGQIALSENILSAEDVHIECEPNVGGVVAAATREAWTLTILPGTARPLKLFCTAHSPNFTSDAVAVAVPTEESTAASLDRLPELRLKRRMMGPAQPMGTVPVPPNQ